MIIYRKYRVPGTFWSQMHVSYYTIIIISLNDVRSTFPLSDPFQAHYTNVAFTISQAVSTDLSESRVNPHKPEISLSGIHKHSSNHYFPALLFPNRCSVNFNGIRVESFCFMKSEQKTSLRKWLLGLNYLVKLW